MWGIISEVFDGSELNELGSRPLGFLPREIMTKSLKKMIVGVWGIISEVLDGSELNELGFRPLGFLPREIMITT